MSGNTFKNFFSFPFGGDAGGLLFAEAFTNGINPRILILDEPFNYLDPSSQIVVARLIREMNRDLGTTVLVSSHNLNSISDICERILLLEKGNLVMDKPHVPGSIDPDMEAYFLDAVK